MAPPVSLLRPALLFCLLSAVLMVSHADRHTLTYIYTALSKPVQNDGIHDFTAMGLLDTHMIDYFNSRDKVKIPKQPWMKENLAPDYWVKGTQSRISKQQWFQVNLEILRNRKNESQDDIHVLQWMHGCEADYTPGEPKESMKFIRGIDQYSYNGDSFLYFDDRTSEWVADVSAAVPTKRKWDEVQVLKDYTKGYLEKECLDWLRQFLEYGKDDLKKNYPPEVYMYATSTPLKSSVRLNCLATGFFPPDIVLQMMRDGEVLKEEDLMSTGVRPNEDNTYQRRDSIDIVRTDDSKYSCRVFHAATGVDITKEWDGSMPPNVDGLDPSGGGGGGLGPVIGGVVVGILVLVGVAVGAVVFYKRNQREPQTNGFMAVRHVPNDPPAPCVINVNGGNGVVPHNIIIHNGVRPHDADDDSYENVPLKKADGSPTGSTDSAIGGSGQGSGSQSSNSLPGSEGGSGQGSGSQSSNSLPGSEGGSDSGNDGATQPLMNKPE